MAENTDLIDEYMTALAARDIPRALHLYAPDATVVRYEGVARGHDEIRAFLVGFLSRFEQFDLVSVDQVQRSGDTIVWDSTHETGAGLLQETNVFLLDGEALVARHVPFVRGYWGKP